LEKEIKKKQKIFKRKSSYKLELLVLGEAVPAVHGPALCWLERHFAFLTAVRAHCLVHFARSTVATAAASSEAAAAATASTAPASSAVSAAVISKSHLYSPIFSRKRCPHYALKPAIHCRKAPRWIYSNGGGL
jgi:hypothetical protein